MTLLRRQRMFFRFRIFYTLAIFFLQLPCFAQQTTVGKAPVQLEVITPGIALYRDVVNVGVIQRNGKALLIDSGEGDILSVASDLGVESIEWVLYTHHHRDQCSGATRLKRAGAKIAVPAAEAHFFEHATDFWQDANKVVNSRYNVRPNLLVLRDSVSVDRRLETGEVFAWEGLQIQVVASPGHTDGSLSYLVETDGQRVAFTGDLIYGPGQLWDFYSLQKGFPGMGWDYWGFGGAVPVLLESLERLLSYQPVLLVPSHGVVIREPIAAVSLLRERLQAAMTNYLSLTSWRVFLKAVPASDVRMLDPLPRPELPSWLHRVSETSWYIQAEDHSIFLFDPGMFELDHEMNRLRNEGLISRIDALWISHYHDDHVALANSLRRWDKPTLYAQKELVDILEHPLGYSMPVLHSDPTPVDHPLAEGETIEWKGYKLTGFYFPGQTLYHGGLLIEHEGTRVFHVGDSFTNWGIDDYNSYNRNFLGPENGYEQCLRLLLRLQPDLLLAAHWGPLPVTEEYLQETLKRLQERGKLFSSLFPWENPNFGLDPSWIRTYPYRQHVLPGSLVTLEARIYNHCDWPRWASVELRVPEGWQLHLSSGSMRIPPHTDGRIRLAAVAPAKPSLRRQVLGLAVEFEGRNLGERVEAIVDFLD